MVVLSEFLSRTCLTYCEFLELSKTVLAQFTAKTDSTTTNPAFPDCEPCCLKDYRITIPQGDPGQQALLQIALFIRLWRKLKHACNAGYTFEQLYDICTVLNWFSGAAINPSPTRTWLVAASAVAAITSPPERKQSSISQSSPNPSSSVRWAKAGSASTSACAGKPTPIDRVGSPAFAARRSRGFTSSFGGSVKTHPG